MCPHLRSRLGRHSAEAKLSRWSGAGGDGGEGGGLGGDGGEGFLGTTCHDRGLLEVGTHAQRYTVRCNG